MRLNCVNLPTNHVAPMRDFYVMALRARCDETHGGPDRCEILTEGATLVLCRVNAPVIPHPESCGLEFLVDDVDAEYERLRALGVDIPALPVTYPWGWRAFGFRDPDGNNIDFVQPVGAE